MKRVAPYHFKVISSDFPYPLFPQVIKDTIDDFLQNPQIGVNVTTSYATTGTKTFYDQSFEVYKSSLPLGAVAIAPISFNTDNGNIISCDIVISQDYLSNGSIKVGPYENYETFPLDGLVAHEFMHCLGFDHEDQEHSVMGSIAKLYRDSHLRNDPVHFLEASLQPDDYQGIRAVYGNQSTIGDLALGATAQINDTFFPIQTTQTAVEGTSFFQRVSIRNTSVQSLNVPIKIYLSLDNILDSSDLEMTSTTINVGSMSVESTDIYMIAPTPAAESQSFRVFVVLDEANAIAETNEFNNVGQMYFPIRITKGYDTLATIPSINAPSLSRGLADGLIEVRWSHSVSRNLLENNTESFLIYRNSSCYGTPDYFIDPNNISYSEQAMATTVAFDLDQNPHNVDHPISIKRKYTGHPWSNCEFIGVGLSSDPPIAQNVTAQASQTPYEVVLNWSFENPQLLHAGEFKVYRSPIRVNHCKEDPISELIATQSQMPSLINYEYLYSLNSDQGHYYYVTYLDHLGIESDCSPGSFARPNSVTTMTPEILAITTNLSTQINLSWSLIPSSTGYRVYRSNLPNLACAGAPLAERPANYNTFFADTSASPGPLWYYSVSAMFQAVEGPCSEIATGMRSTPTRPDRDPI
jgi:hypothetical protein